MVTTGSAPDGNATGVVKPTQLAILLKILIRGQTRRASDHNAPQVFFPWRDRAVFDR